MDLPVNTGLSGAIKSGMRYANYYGYDYVLQLDGDGQHDPKYIEEMIEEEPDEPVEEVVEEITEEEIAEEEDEPGRACRRSNGRIRCRGNI